MLPEFKKRIDTLRDILVGAVPSPAGQIEQITYALLYKFMSDIDDRATSVEGGKRTYFTGNYEKYDWHKIMGDTLGAHEQLTLYREALGNLAKNPGLPELFQGIYQNAYLTFNDPRVLRLFLKEIDTFKHSNSDDIGDAYEYLLQITGAQGDVGQFRTPRHIIKFIVEAVNPSKNDSVLDPAVGTAGFLIAAYNHVKHHHDGVDDITGLPDKNERLLTADEKERLNTSYHGFDIDPTMVRTAKVNMYLHGFTTPDIKNHDSLSSEEYWNERYDVILANPPFMSPKGGIKPHDKFGIVANRAEVLFVDYIASHLKPTGRAGIVVPEGIIFQGGKAYKELRKNLVDDYVYAVVSLPAGVFQPYSGVKTSVLLLDKELSKQRDEILFIKIENDGYGLGAQRRKIVGDQFPEALKVIKNFQNSEEITSELAHLVPKEQIRQSGDYSLSGDRYKVVRSNSSEWDIVPLRDVILEAKDGGTPPRSNPANFNGGIKWAVIKDILPNIYETRETISELGLKNSSAKLWPVGTIIISLGATIGKVGIARVPLATKQGLTGLIVDNSKIIPEYLAYLLSSSTELINNLASGVTIKEVRPPRLLDNFKIPLIPIEIQREIVSELDGYQKIIDAAQTIVKTYKPTINIDSEWPVVKIGELFKTSSGGTPSKSKPEYYQDGNIPWLGSGEVSQGIVTQSKNKITEEALKNSSAKIFPVDSVLIAMYGATVGQVGILKFESATNQAVCAIIPNLDVAIPDFIYHLMKTYKQNLVALSAGGAQPNISQNIIRNFTIPLPPLKEQGQIAAQLEAEQQLINANKKLIETFQQKIKSKIAEVWGE